MNIGSQSKAKDVSKTGKFGVGFCSNYHYTDVPCWVSELGVCYSDPMGLFVSPSTVDHIYNIKYLW